MLIVELEDGIFYLNLTNIDISICKIGFFKGNRVFRRDDDREPVFYIPMDWFRFLKV